MNDSGAAKELRGHIRSQIGVLDELHPMFMRDLEAFDGFLEKLE